jgi:hypothetical protein
MEKPIIKYAIYFDYKTLGQWNGKKSLEAVTNNPEKWLQEHNAQRVEDNCCCQIRNPEECNCVVEESLSDFIIEELSGEIIYED